MVETPARGRALRQPEALAFLWDTITTWQFALAVIVIFGAVLRFHGLGWDKPAGAETPLQMHPDERFLSFVANDTTWPSSVSEYFDTQASPLNPYNAPNINAYVYGTFPMFLVKGVDTGYRALPGWGRDGLGILSVNAPGGVSKYDVSFGLLAGWSGREVADILAGHTSFPSDPKEVHDAWLRLRPDQQAALLAGAPARFGNLNGIPAADRNTANRQTLASRHCIFR